MKMKRFVTAFWLFQLFVVFIAQGQGAPQVTVIRYDTIVVKDKENPSVEQWMIYNRNSGRMIRSGRVENGKKDGIWKSYYENGMISRIEEFNDDVQGGTAVSIETNGYVSKEENIVNGVKNGICREYNRNGTIKLEENYADGKLNGWRRVFSNDGKLQEEGNWKEGMRDSINRWAYPGGKIYVEYFYRGGNINGPGKIYFESGKLKAEGNFTGGYENGNWKEYSDSTGKLVAEGAYLNGKKTGTWKYFSDDGSPLKTQEFDAEGNLIKETLAPAGGAKTKSNK
jgi:antitoxin component YwqK of YwqJK toxin-antitoxin module